jgi:ATP-dependent DNA helicase RecQ
VRHTLDTLATVVAETGRPVSTAALEARVELGRTRLETMLKVLDVDGAVRRVAGGWESTGEHWAYDAERYHALAEARRREREAMLAYLDTDACRMWFLRDQLDDDANWPAGSAPRCGRCDNCGGLALSTAVSAGAVEGATARLSRPGVAVEPRKMWPTALSALGLDLSGRIADPPLEGRAVARLTDLGYGQPLRALFREGTPDGPVPEPLVRAVIEVLTDWRPPVDAIVHVESARRPTLVRDLAEGLSRYLRAPITGRFAIVDPGVAPGQGAMNSAQRVAAVDRRFAFEGVARGSVLLVDDLVGTGWTLTLAARAVRAAGAAQVVPLTLAVQG